MPPCPVRETGNSLTQYLIISPTDFLWGILRVETSLTSEQRFWRWRILLATYAAYAGYYLTRKAYTICKTSIQADFDWDSQAIAHIWTSYLIAYAVGQFVCSYLGRKHGPRALLLGGLGISIVINAMFGLANSYATFICLMIVNGLAQASGWPGAVGGVAEWLRPKERGAIMGFWCTNYVVGNMVVKFAGGLLLHTYGWRFSFVGLSALTCFVWALLHLWQRNRPEDVGLDPIVQDREHDGRAVRASEESQVTWPQYLQIAMNPVVLTMGISYFSIKFLRYALDSWLPAFLNYQGMDVARASYYSSIFDWAGLVGAVAAGIAVDRLFRGNWALLCFVMGLGMIIGYLAVIYLGVSPVLIAVWFGLVGFMVYGPDTLLSGAAAVAVAGERNGVAVAGIVNGVASIGPIIQEEVVGWLIRGEIEAGMRNTNRLALAMSILFTVLMLVMIWRLRATHAKHRERDAKASGQ